MLGNLLAGLGLVVALLSGLLLMHFGLSSESGRDGGRALGVMMVSLPFWVALLLAYTVATLRGGFDWLGLSRIAALVLVLLAVTAAVLVNAGSAALRVEPASQVPWALLPLRGWLHAVWPALLLAGAVWALWPAPFTAWPPLAGRLPLLVLGGVSLLTCALMLVQWLQASQQSSVAAAQRRVDDDKRRDTWVRAQVLAADPQKDLVSLMTQTSQYEKPDIRALALQKVHAHPRLNDALAEMLRNGWRDHAFIFLQSNPAPDAAALALPVRDGLFGMAEELRERMRKTHTLRSDEFEPEVARLLAVADEYAEFGVDYRPAVQAVRDALDEPRRQTLDLPARHTLDRWLQGATTRR